MKGGIYKPDDIAGIDSFLAEKGYDFARNGGLATLRDRLKERAELASSTNRNVLLVINNGPNGDWYQISVRPYRIGERCDGTRDVEALTMLHYMLFELSEKWGAASVLNWLDEFEYVHPGHSLEWFSPDGLDPVEDWLDFSYDHSWPVSQIEQLLADLYDMNRRTLVDFLVTKIEKLIGEDLAYTPGLIDHKYQKPESDKCRDSKSVNPVILEVVGDGYLAGNLAEYFHEPSFEKWSELYSTTFKGKTVWQACNLVYPGWLPTSVGSDGWPFVPDPEKVLSALKNI